MAYGSLYLLSIKTLYIGIFPGNTSLFIDSLLNCNVVHIIENLSWKRQLHPVVIMEITAA